ncbi:MAG: hypothetical protein ABJN40_05875 [Sneathiella sp.]
MKHILFDPSALGLALFNSLRTTSFKHIYSRRDIHRGRSFKPSNNRYVPHQGEQEKARRRRQSTRIERIENQLKL